MKTLNRPVDRRERDIKKKLMAAVAMLLLSCSMVVTSTFAWFTLSTAPEVTGIQTTIGGNGNLEIALAGSDDAGTLLNVAESTATDGAATSLLDKNITWGNLVDLSAQEYGLGNITLYPAALNVSGDKVVTTSMLQVPEYGPDGRVTKLVSTVAAGSYDTASKHFKTNGYGVRGLGVSSSKTERQFAYSGALTNISSNMTNAEAAVENALSEQGGQLTDIAIAYGLGTTAFTADQVAALEALITKTKVALPYMEQSIVSFIDGILASNYGKTTLKITDTDYLLISSTIQKLDVDSSAVTVDGNTVTVSVTVDGKPYTYSYTEATLANAITAYKSISSKLSLAEDAIDDLTPIASGKDAGKYAVSEIKKVLGYLMAFSLNEGDKKVTIEGYTLAQVKGDPEGYAGELAMAMGTGLDLELNKDSGVYYDIASLIGKLSSRFLADVNVAYGGASINVKGATIVISSTPENPAYFTTLTTVVGGLKEPSGEGASEKNQIDDLYAFALDLYFRTNAADSKLVLQTNPAQRIYEDGNNANTMGAGSTVTFTFDSSLDETKVRSLLNSIKIVFINGDAGDDNGTILAKAKLDSTNAVIDGYNVTANIYLYSETTENGVTTQTLLDDKSPIRSLDQNKAHLVTTLVYLDGETIRNADVATAAQSMTGSMNLQFASDAQLEAMDYTALKQGDTKDATPKLKVDATNNKLNLTGLDSSKTNVLTYTIGDNTQTLVLPTIANGETSVDITDVLAGLAADQTVTFKLTVDSKDTYTATYKK